MDNPVKDIEPLVQKLCTGDPEVQKQAIETYFTPQASFIHPFCRTGSSPWSKWMILCIFQWYKALSPEIAIQVNSVAFDEKNLILYVSMFQVFKIWFVPFYKAPVSLVTKLQLTTVYDTNQDEDSGSQPASSSSSSEDPEKKTYAEAVAEPATKTKYYIASQEDLYQTSEFIKFAVPFGIGVSCVLIWQYVATIFCVLGAYFDQFIGFRIRNVFNTFTSAIQKPSDRDQRDLKAKDGS